MQYRELGKTGCQVSILSFGCMRLPHEPTEDNEPVRFDPSGPVDEAEATRMIHYAYDQGINYFDTAYGYHGGKSELILGRALKGFRDRVFLATKLPVWLVESAADFDRLLEEQRRKLGTWYLDFYLLHNLNQQNWPKMKSLGVLQFLDRIRREDKVRYVGFSFHDDLHTFRQIVDAYSWDICQLQYNFLDEHFQAGRQGVEYAAARGVGVVAMEPLRGGKLTQGIPPEVEALWQSAPVWRSPAEWALRWVWNQPEISTALSGMSNLEQLKENLPLANLVGPPILVEAELELIQRVVQVYRRMLKIQCSTCGYCMPCPTGVNIPVNFSLYNDAMMFHDAPLSRAIYNHFLAPAQQAVSCAECGKCEPLCPQQIKIPEELKKVHAQLREPPE
jgi:hypothetical protein